MKVPFVLAVVAAAVGLSATPAAADDLAHPAPLGPQRPYEPAVPGPENIESGTAYVERLGTGVAVTFDGVRGTATGEKPAAPRAPSVPRGRAGTSSGRTAGSQVNRGIWSHCVTGQKTPTEGRTPRP